MQVVLPKYLLITPKVISFNLLAQLPLFICSASKEQEGGSVRMERRVRWLVEIMLVTG